MKQFVRYIEDVLHIKITIFEQTSLNELPLYLRNGYDVMISEIQDIKFLLVYPKEQTNLTTTRKQTNQLKKLTGFECVLCLNEVGAYTKEKMLSEGIPFVIPGKQVYLPFLGIALSQNVSREIPYVDKLSFSTQRLLLTAIYRGWSQTSLTEAADALALSKMTLSRCFDELQAVGLGLVETIGKTRCFSLNGNRRELWDAIVPFLRNPVKRQYRLGSQIEIDDVKLGGISALCHYSMLAEDSYTVYSVSTKTTAKLPYAKSLPLIPEIESPVMVLQVMQYDLDYHDNHVVDPLTAVLSISEEDKADPRVDAAINEVLENCLRD